MKLKRGIALLLAAVFLFGTLAVPASAAAAQPEPAAQAQTVDAEENDIISVRIKASGELTYGADHKLEQTGFSVKHCFRLKVPGQ